MKSRNLNLKHDCKLCKEAKERKRARLDEEDNSDEESGHEEEDDEILEQDEDDDLPEDLVKKRRRTGENHSHCHCPLFEVTEPLLDFMGGGQPCRRFKTDQQRKREAFKVNKVLSLQKRKADKLRYESDIKTEINRFKRSIRNTSVGGGLNNNQATCSTEKTPAEKREERIKRQEELKEKRAAAKDALPLLF